MEGSDSRRNGFFRFIPKLSNFFSLRLAPETSQRALSNPQLASLITRFGTPPHTAWLDPKYHIFTMSKFESAVGYVKCLNCAVVFGEPLCESSKQDILTHAFEAMCRVNKWKPIYCSTRQDFAYGVGERGGGYIQFGVEEILKPDSNKTSRTIRKEIKPAQEAGVVIKEYVRPEGGDESFEAECEDLIANWLEEKQKQGKQQMHASRVQPFIAGAETRWLTARLGDKLVGLLTLTRLASQDGYFIEHIIVAAAPAGTSQLLVNSSIAKLREQHCTYLSWGIAPESTLGETKGIPKGMEKRAKKIYAAEVKKKSWPDYATFHSKFGVKRRENLYVAFPGKCSVRKLTALVLAMKSRHA